jgi:hypothetical protein
MNNKNRLTAILILILMTAFALHISASDGCGDCSNDCSGDDCDHEQETTTQLRGRDFVRLGELGTVTGTLKPDKGEWFLHTEENIYEIHLGDHEHRAKTGIKLEEGKTAQATGFIYTQEGSETIDISVCTIVLDEKEYRFREDDGTPLWQGCGSGGRHRQ